MTLSHRGAPGVRPPRVKVAPHKNACAPFCLQHSPGWPPPPPGSKLGSERRRARQSSWPGPRPNPQSPATQDGEAARDAGLPQPSSSRGPTPSTDVPQSPRRPLLEASRSPGAGRHPDRRLSQPAPWGTSALEPNPIGRLVEPRRPLPRRRPSAPTEGAGSNPCTRGASRGSEAPWAAARCRHPTPGQYQEDLVIKKLQLFSLLHA